MKRFLKNKYLIIMTATVMIASLATVLTPVQTVFASKVCGGGDGYTAVNTSIDLGCIGGTANGGPGNPITDLLFAVIRFLSAGVGIVIVASVIVGGIQFTTARDDPNAASKARGRISTAVIALMIYIFSYALLNYLIPGGFFHA